MQLRGLARSNTNKLYRARGSLRPLLTERARKAPDLEAVREYLLYLSKSELSAEGIDQQVSALKFLYLTTLEMPRTSVDFPRAKRRRSLPVVPSREELLQFFDHVPSIRYRAARRLLRRPDFASRKPCR